MKRIDFKRIMDSPDRDMDGYFCVEEDGELKCSCGRALVQIDEDTYRCDFGYPIYRFSDGEVFLDKYGNLMLKKKGDVHGNR